MIRSFTRNAGLLLVICLISACGRNAGTPTPSSVAVSTVQPVKRAFTRSITAFGSAIGNPRHARQLSPAYGGKVIAIAVSNGQSVRSGQPLLKIAVAPATRKAFKQAQNALALARDQLARDTQLAAQHLATRAQVDAARKAVSDANAALQAQLQLGGSKAVDTVTAPAAGTVTDIQVTRGQRVPANTVLATFTPAQGLIAQVGVQPGQAAQIAAGMPVTLHVVYGSSAVASGRVSMVGHAVDPTTHLVPVEVAIPAAWASSLVAGSALSAHIGTNKFDAWAVPRNALQSDAHGNYVFQIEHGKAHRVDVKVLSPNGSPVGIQGTIDPQAPIITLGSYEVSEGEAIHASHPVPSHAHGNAGR